MYCLYDKIEMRGAIGQSFPAIIDGILTEMSINAETKTGVITAIIPGPMFNSEPSYMIKYKPYTFPIRVDQDYIMKFNCCCCHCPCQCSWSYY